MRADRIKLGMIVDISLGDPKADEFKPLAAEVVDRETNAEAVSLLMRRQFDGPTVALRLRQEGKQRGCWVGIPATDQLPVLRR